MDIVKKFVWELGLLVVFFFYRIDVNGVNYLVFFFIKFVKVEIYLNFKWFCKCVLVMG